MLNRRRDFMMRKQESVQASVVNGLIARHVDDVAASTVRNAGSRSLLGEHEVRK